jgi:hypothetical protein
MSRKRQSVEISYAHGFVPWNWWHKDKTANPLVQEEFSYFQTWGFERFDDQWVAADFGPGLVRPNCKKCESSSTACVEKFTYECLSCGEFFRGNHEALLQALDGTNRQGPAGGVPAGSPPPQAQDVPHQGGTVCGGSQRDVVVREEG